MRMTILQPLGTPTSPWKCPRARTPKPLPPYAPLIQTGVSMDSYSTASWVRGVRCHKASTHLPGSCCFLALVSLCQCFGVCFPFCVFWVFFLMLGVFKLPLEHLQLVIFLYPYFLYLFLFLLLHTKSVVLKLFRSQGLLKLCSV